MFDKSYKRRWSSASLMRLNEASVEEPKEWRVKGHVLTREDFFPSGGLPSDPETSKFVLHPDSSFRLLWDVTSMLLILVQAIAVPYLLAFESESEEFWNAFEDSVTAFFATDILLNFNSAYYDDGSIVAQRKAIAKNYLKIWFWVDLLTTFPYDWFIPSEESEVGFLNAPQLLRILKLQKLVRLGRLAKVKKIIIEIEDYISSHLLANLLVLLRLVIFAYYIAHWIACLWYLIAVVDSQYHPETWLNDAYIESQSSFEIYITALYWAFTTMTTVGYGDIHPITTNEIIFTIIAMAVACAMFAYTIGSIGGLVSKQNAEASAYREQVVALNSYMKEKKLPHDLRFRVRRYLDFVWDNQKRTTEQPILELISEPLREEIFVYTRGEAVKSCFLFDRFEKNFLLYITKVMRSKTFAPNDTIFKQGEKSTSMYFIVNGQVELFDSVTLSIFKALEKGEYFGEVEFFTKRSRACSARCVEFVEFLIVHREDLEATLFKYPQAEEVMEFYSSQCREGDLSVLRVNCFICGKLGHLAQECSWLLIQENGQNLKDNWLKSREGRTKLANPFLSTSLKRTFPRNILKTRYKAPNTLGKPRNPKEIYKDDPSVLFKLKKFHEQSPSASGKNSLNSSLFSKNISRIDELLSESESDKELLEDPFIEELRHNCLSDNLEPNPQEARQLLSEECFPEFKTF